MSVLAFPNNQVVDSSNPVPSVTDFLPHLLRQWDEPIGTPNLQIFVFCNGLRESCELVCNSAPEAGHPCWPTRLSGADRESISTNPALRRLPCNDGKMLDQIVTQAEIRASRFGQSVNRTVQSIRFLLTEKGSYSNPASLLLFSRCSRRLRNGSCCVKSGWLDAPSPTAGGGSGAILGRWRRSREM